MAPPVFIRPLKLPYKRRTASRLERRPRGFSTHLESTLRRSRSATRRASSWRRAVAPYFCACAITGAAPVGSLSSTPPRAPIETRPVRNGERGESRGSTLSPRFGPPRKSERRGPWEGASSPRRVLGRLRLSASKSAAATAIPRRTLALGGAGMFNFSYKEDYRCNYVGRELYTVYRTVLPNEECQEVGEW